MTDVTWKPSLARGPVVYTRELSLSSLNNNNNKYQNPKQYCDHSDLANKTNIKDMQFC
jgi:hypothetical protein